MCVCVSACAKRKCEERMQIDLGPLTSTCINFAAIVIWPRNAEAAKAFIQITRKQKETETGNASLSQVYWMCLKDAHTMCFFFLASVYSSAKSTVNNNIRKKEQQQQRQRQHRSISNSSKTTYEDETFILNLLPNLLGDTA